MLEYHGQPGEHISKSAAHSLELSRKRGSPVEIIFNDIRLVVDYHSHTADQVVEMYDCARAKRHEEWRASSEGIAYASEEEQRRQEHQVEHDELMSQLLMVGGDEPRLMEWLAAYSDAADHVGVEGKDFLRVCSVLEVLGYVEGDCVGFPEHEFQNPRVMARYIAGQAISCMRLGMGPHPITGSFVEKYRALAARETEELSRASREELLARLAELDG